MEKGVNLPDNKSRCECSASMVQAIQGEAEFDLSLGLESWATKAASRRSNSRMSTITPGRRIESIGSMRLNCPVRRVIRREQGPICLHCCREIGCILERG